MLQSLTLAALLSLTPAQNGTLALTGERVTFGGVLGPRRENNQFLPGDICYLAFDIENLKATAEGTVMYSLGLEVTDSGGRSVYSARPGTREVTLALGASKLAASGFYGIQPDQRPGKLTLKLAVKDLNANTAKTLTKEIEVLPSRFGTVAVTTYLDPNKQIPAPLVAVEGQNLFVMFAIVGFGRDAKTKQPSVVAEIRVLDQAGKPVTEKPPIVVPLPAGVRVAENEALLVFDPQLLPLSRAGVFTVEIKTECKVTGKTDKVTFPLNVIAAQK